MKGKKKNVYFAIILAAQYTFYFSRKFLVEGKKDQDINYFLQVLKKYF